MPGIYTARRARVKDVWSRAYGSAGGEMRFLSVIVVLAGLLSAAQSSAATGDNLQPASPDKIQSYETGYSLMTSCNNPQQRAYCVGYIIGVIDAHNSLAGTRADKGLRICLTNGLLKSQAAAAAVKYLGEHQDLLNSDAASAAYEALAKAFPCA
jgi:Rap1a immunity proteins